MFDPTQLATICNHRLLGIVQAEKVMRRTHWAMPCSSCGQQLFFLTWSCWVALEPCRSIIEFHKASRIIDIKSIDTHSSPHSNSNDVQGLLPHRWRCDSFWGLIMFDSSGQHGRSDLFWHRWSKILLDLTGSYSAWLATWVNKTGALSNS